MTNAVDTSKEAVERVSAYLAEHDRRAKNGGTFAADHIHTLGMADDGLELTASDLRSLLSERDQLRREVQEARDKIGLMGKALSAIEALKARP